MTAFSAKVDEHGQWFNTPLPGLLSDVFGMKTNAFYDAESSLKFDLDGREVGDGVHRYEVLEPSTATVLPDSPILDHSPAVTINKFGKGNAMYWRLNRRLGDGACPEPCYKTLAGIQLGPTNPEGVYARVVDGRTLYVNTTSKEKSIPIAGRKKGIISKRVYDGEVVLGPFGAVSHPVIDLSAILGSRKPPPVPTAPASLTWYCLASQRSHVPWNLRT